MNQKPTPSARLTGHFNAVLFDRAADPDTALYRLEGNPDTMIRVVRYSQLSPIIRDCLLHSVLSPLPGVIPLEDYEIDEKAQTISRQEPLCIPLSVFLRDQSALLSPCGGPKNELFLSDQICSYPEILNIALSLCRDLLALKELDIGIHPSDLSMDRLYVSPDSPWQVLLSGQVFQLSVDLQPDASGEEGQSSSITEYEKQLLQKIGDLMYDLILCNGEPDQPYPDPLSEDFSPEGCPPSMTACMMDLLSDPASFGEEPLSSLYLRLSSIEEELCTDRSGNQPLPLTSSL